MALVNDVLLCNPTIGINTVRQTLRMVVNYGLETIAAQDTDYFPQL